MNAEYLYHSGDDLAIVNAARVSFSKESKEFTEQDEKLISYLAKHGHWSPFTHNSITLRMKAPTNIRTQCFKTKIGFSENEESRRYISTYPELYVPDVFRSKPEGSIKQGSGPPDPNSNDWRDEYMQICDKAIEQYQYMIREGVAPEQARFILPQGVMVNWIWTGSLMAYARFYNQRTDPHAQKEIQDLAKQVGEIIEPLFPISWKVLT